MRAWAVLVWLPLAACGRIGFDLAARDAGIGDGSAIDTPVGQACTSDLECGRCARCTGTCQVEPVNTLVLGHRTTCYLGAGNDRWCAGGNNEGQLGLGDLQDRATPTHALDGGGWEALYQFYYGRTIGVRGGQEWEWGNGNPTPVANAAAHPVRDALGDLAFVGWWETDGTTGLDPSGSSWTALDYGADHTCAIKAGRMYCWGINRGGSLGQPAVGEGVSLPSPVPVGVDVDWKTVAVGGDLQRGFSCGLKQSGQLYCWGDPFFTGTGGVNVGASPTEIGNGLQFAWVDATWEHACAGQAGGAGAVWCWGHDTYGGYVAPQIIGADAPLLVPGTYTDWRMGGHHACGKTAAGRWRCFGWNTFGQLGVGTTMNDGAMVDLCP